MSSLHFGPKLPDLPGFRVDAVLGDTVFVVLVDPRDLRRFRASLMEVARISSTDRRRHSILILDEPQISDERLREEWEAAQTVLQHDITERLTFVILREEMPEQIIGSLSEEERSAIDAVAEHARQNAIRSVRRPSEAFFDILRVLLINWFRNSGPLTSKELSEQSGFSYPTLASALRKLEKHLIRHSDRRVELKTFPKDEWSRLVANADKVRQTLRFADHSGQPRSIESLITRFEAIRFDDIALGGVPGARHIFPAIDLIGTPRLDLTIHCRTRKPDLSFLRRLDPALKPARPDDPARLVIHTIRYSHSFFDKASDGSFWADPVECLLDLHEMRLEPQAAEFLRFLTLRTI